MQLVTDHGWMAANQLTALQYCYKKRCMLIKHSSFMRAEVFEQSKMDSLRPSLLNLRKIGFLILFVKS